MDKDRKANTRCTWFTQIGYVHGVEEFPLIVKGLHKYIGLCSHFVDVASSLEVLFFQPRVVSLTGGDAQGLVKRDTNHVVGVPQVAELGDLQKEVTDKSIRPTQEFKGQNKSIKSRVRSTLMIWDTFNVDKVVDVAWRGFALWRRHQRKVRARAKEKTRKKHDMDTLAFNPDDMRYSCSDVACLQRYYCGEKKLSISRDSAESALSDVKKS
ncbi:hypothetical protein ACFX11_039894 [Malus domestica]